MKPDTSAPCPDQKFPVNSITKHRPYDLQTLGRFILSRQKVSNGRGQGRITAQAGPSYPLEGSFGRKVQRNKIRYIGRCYPAPGIYNINRPMTYTAGKRTKKYREYNQIIRSNKVSSFLTNPRAVVESSKKTAICNEPGGIRGRTPPIVTSSGQEHERIISFFTAVTSNYLFVMVT